VCFLVSEIPDGGKQHKKLSNSDVSVGMKDKLYSAVVSASSKVLPDEGPCAAETCSSNEEQMYIVTFEICKNTFSELNIF
jgi:hypothetical protein